MLKLYPSLLLNHPIFKLEFRRTTWATSPAHFNRRTVKLFLWTIISLSLFWLFGLYNSAKVNDTHVYLTSQSLIMLAMVFSALANVGLDLTCVTRLSSLISGDIQAGRWDVLRLTGLNEREVIAAKHTVALAHVWRGATFVTSVRITSVILFEIHSAFVPYISGTNLGSALHSLQTQPVSAALGLATLAIFFLIFMIEAVWRTQAMTAVGLAISARIHNSSLAILVGVLAIIAVWVAQFLLLGVMSGIGLMLIRFFSGNIWSSDNYVSADAFAISLFISCVLTALTVYTFYTLLRAISLRLALRYAFAD